MLFLSLEDLADHVSKYHGHAGRGGLFYCGWEGCSRGQRGFNARYKMLVHVRTHTNEKPHHCFTCDKSFSRAENLKIHARSHTGKSHFQGITIDWVNGGIVDLNFIIKSFLLYHTEYGQVL